VAPFTDPGWTPLLNVAAGVVTENGGLLSHAAVICREYAVPAVLNVTAATRLLRDGQKVRLDGEQGYVDVL
jgi:pyruvate,water dikinase